jgi:hypothetical protein
VLVLDSTLQVTQNIELPCENPFTSFAQLQAHLLLGCAGNFNQPGTAALVALSLTDHTTAKWLSETELHGPPTYLHSENDVAYLMVAVPESVSNPFVTLKSVLYKYEANVLTPLHENAGFSLGGLSSKNGTVYFGNRSSTGHAGLWQFTNAAYGPFRTSLPPYDLVVW